MSEFQVATVLQTEMMTRAELAFSALDKDNSGFISTRELRKLSAKLSEEELRALMVKVKLPCLLYNLIWAAAFHSSFIFQLDADGDGQLSLEEFKVLFDNAEKRKKDTKRMVNPLLLLQLCRMQICIAFCQASSHLVFSSCSFPIFLISPVIYIIVVIPQESLKHGSGENENSSVSKSISGNKTNKKKTT